MGEAKQRKRRLAFHEASHAVFARLHGVSRVEVTVENENDAHVCAHSAHWAARGSPDRSVWLRAYEIDAKTAMAGGVVDTLRGIRPKRELPKDDTKNAVSFTMRIATFDRATPLPDGPGTVSLTAEEFVETEILYRRFWEETADELREHWSAIEKVAELFMSCTSVGEALIDRTIAEAMETI